VIRGEPTEQDTVEQAGSNQWDLRCEMLRHDWSQTERSKVEVQAERTSVQ